jgi:uncharacterized protein YndB with AHSA1/START domain
MTTATEAQERAVVLSRTFDAPRKLVFQAWTSADHVKNWFCPAGFTVPQAVVECRPGGAFNVCMRSPDGHEHWTNGHFLEVDSERRLVIEMQVAGADKVPLFSTHTVVSFADAERGTRVEVKQTYTLFAPEAAAMVGGAAKGWEQTLERLGQELARMGRADGQRSVVHGSFRLERSYPASREQVFKALTDPDAKAKWFIGGAGYTTLARHMEVRPGGREHLQGRWESGVVSTFDATYFDVIPNERLVYAYEMHLDERKISVSLASFELRAEGTGTRVVLTENGAFLDGYDDAGSRERGTNMLLDALGGYLTR